MSMKVEGSTGVKMVFRPCNSRIRLVLNSDAMGEGDEGCRGYWKQGSNNPSESAMERKGIS